ncbi:hypothetical protein [Butyrivibrio fibrisolvens]|jgi:hypothetical protein|uniref:hypothetical protein n=1 Tax=Butyrivibrio fibrisolvens TaxID=831 RepID=UPI0012BB8203|nr:hypothetical protein [Butyrivibrio fibrisolvens]
MSDKSLIFSEDEKKYRWRIPNSIFILQVFFEKAIKKMVPYQNMNLTSGRRFK